MTDYKEMYLKLFRTQTEVIEMLQNAHRETEDMYIEAEPTPLTLMTSDTPDKADDADDDGGGS